MDAPDVLFNIATGVTAAMLFATLITVPLSFVILMLYSRAVLAGMRQHGAVNDPISPPLLPTEDMSPPDDSLDVDIVESGSRAELGPVAQRIFRRATHGHNVSAMIYSLAGLGHAIVATGVMFQAADLEMLPLRTTVVLWANLWPLVVVADLITLGGLRSRLRNTGIYFAVGTILSVLANDNWYGIPLYFVLVNGPPTIFLLPLLHPRLRSVAPLVFSFMVIGVGGALIAFRMATTTWGTGILARLAVLFQLESGDGTSMRIGFSMEDSLRSMGPIVLLYAVMLAGFLVFGLIGWAFLNWIGHLYETKKVSDLSVVVDSVWLVFTLSDALTRSFESTGWAVAALGSFVVYKLLALVGFGIVARYVGARRNHRLLLLRVFGFRERSERLISLVGSQWRHVGSIQLIAATDLCSTTVEPHEFLAFAHGRLNDRYVKGQAALDRQLAKMDTRPDHDGRFRVNEFFCHDDTWKMTLSRLASYDDAILMDLRGFSPYNQGCCFELEQLVNLVPLTRVVLIVDKTTDIPFMRATLDQAWATIHPHSPNRTLRPARVTAFNLVHDDRKGANLLIAELSEAIAPGTYERAAAHAKQTAPA